jgi:hypothetical protein
LQRMDFVDNQTASRRFFCFCYYAV